MDHQQTLTLSVVLPRRSGGEGIALKLCAGDKVSKVKELLHKSRHRLPEHGSTFHLLRNGVELDDAMDLSAAGLKTGDALHVMPRVSSSLKLWLERSPNPAPTTDRVALRMCKSFSISWPNSPAIQPEQQLCERIVRKALSLTEQAVGQREVWASTLLALLNVPLTH